MDLMVLEWNSLCDFIMDLPEKLGRWADEKLVLGEDLALVKAI